MDVSKGRDLMDLIGFHDVVVSAIPYSYGYAVASAALASGTHYLDFGGNHHSITFQNTLLSALTIDQFEFV